MKKPKLASEIQSMGGTARAKALSKERLIAIAKKAARARWNGHVKKPKSKRKPLVVWIPVQVEKNETAFGWPVLKKKQCIDNHQEQWGWKPTKFVEAK